MRIKTDQEGFDAIRKLSDNALRTMGLDALKLVEAVHHNTELENQENGKETQEQQKDLQKKDIG